MQSAKYFASQSRDKCMKRGKFITYLEFHGCYLVREEKKHSVYFNPRAERNSTVPRHTEVNDLLCEKICRDLSLPKIKSKK